MSPVDQEEDSSQSQDLNADVMMRSAIAESDKQEVMAPLLSSGARPRKSRVGATISEVMSSAIVADDECKKDATGAKSGSRTSIFKALSNKIVPVFGDSSTEAVDDLDKLKDSPDHDDVII